MMITSRTSLFILLSSITLLQCSAAYSAEEQEKLVEQEKKIEYKLTPSYYSSTDGNNASDINLRGSIGQHTVWLGIYSDKNNYHQERVGYENRLDLGLTRWVLSAQLASGGFIGGSVTTEIGGDTFGILGIGRTNLRDYYNLNFDPNDAITIGIGTRAIAKTELSFFQVRDDRLDTQQQVTHFVWRFKPSESQRITIDTSYKSGLISDNKFIRGYGLSITYDYHSYFVRIAKDQYANFNDSDLTRLSVGMRF